MEFPEGITSLAMHQGRLTGGLNGMNGMGEVAENLNANRPLNVDEDEDLYEVGGRKIVVVACFDGLVAIRSLSALTYDGPDCCNLD